MKDYLPTGNINEVRFNCPICGDTKFHLYVNRKKHKGVCFRCNYIPTEKEVDELLYSTRIEIPIEEPENIPEKIEVPGVPIKEVEVAKEVLKMIGKEQFSIEELSNAQAKISDEPPFVGVVLPVFLQNKLIGFTCRRVIDKPKYLHSKGYKSSNVLYNFKGGKECVLVEGPFDALWTGGAAVFGHFISKEQLFLLYSSGIKKVTLLFDQDVAFKFLLQEAKKLSKMFDTYIVLLEKGDPCDYSKQEIQNKIHNALSYEQFLVDVIKQM